MIFKHAVPILYSSNVVKSISHYREVLAFENHWHWGHPPTFGGASKNNVEIFFCENGQGNPGTWLSVFVDNVDEYYEQIKANGANILSAPQNMEWGIREMLVEDPDGHRIRFGQQYTQSDREKTAARLPEQVRIVARIPAPAETRHLVTAVGWALSPIADLDTVSPAIVFAVVAEDTNTNELIGCAFVVGDNEGFYYIKNVIVHPAWQSKRIGSAMMEKITAWLEEQAPDNSFVGLHTGPNLARFYNAFGFREAFGMHRTIRKNKE